MTALLIKYLIVSDSFHKFIVSNLIEQGVPFPTELASECELVNTRINFETRLLQR